MVDEWGTCGGWKRENQYLHTFIVGSMYDTRHPVFLLLSLCCGRMSCPGILCFCLFWIEVHPLSDTHHTINRYYSPPSEATTKFILINCIYTGKYNRLAHLPGHHELDWKESTITMVWGNVIKYGCRGYWKGEYIYLGRRTLKAVLLLVLVVWRRSNVVWLWALYSW